MASGVGTDVIDFGSAPGTNIVSTTITGQTDITTSAHVEAWIMSEATATHNAYEHQIAPIKLTVGSLVNGVGFTVSAVTDWRLTGTFNFRWVWST